MSKKVIITDSPVVQEQYLALSAALAIKAGMTEHQALQAVTIHAAEHIGVADRVGSIEVGKDADLIILSGSPFVADADIRYTLIDGKTVYSKARG